MRTNSHEPASDFLSPTGWIKAAQKAHPAFKFAIAVGGLAALVAIVSRFGSSPATLVFGAIVVVVLMVLFLVFAQAARLRSHKLSVASLFLVWAFLCLSIATALLLFTSTFFDAPLPLRSFLIRSLGAPNAAAVEALVPQTLTSAERSSFALVRECRKLLVWSPEYEATVLSGYSERRDDAPMALCERLLQQHPDDPEVNGMFARSLVMAGELEEAIARFERAANLGDVHSKLTLGYYHLEWKADWDRGMGYLQAAAQKGSDEALLAVGKAYELGIRAMPDYGKAAQYYETAGRHGVPEADYRLGQLYEWGLGVTRDANKAKMLYRKAAGLGQKDAVSALDMMLKRR